MKSLRKRSLKPSLGCILWTALMLSAGTAQAQFPAPMFKTGSAKTEQVIEERVFYYKVLPFEPSVEVEAGTTIGYGRPEEAALTILAAMQRGDFEVYRQSWDTVSQKLMADRDQQLGRNASYWTNWWKEALGGQMVKLTHRIETGDFVLIAYEVRAPEGKDDDALTSTLVFKQQGDRWLATQELSGDLVSGFWQSPGHRQRVVARGVDR